MKQITVKYANDCRACGEHIDVGETAMHEKRIGIFHPDCAPDAEELREYRQEALDRRNERLEERAQKRRDEADRLVQRDAHLWRDHAFVTQPGHIPERARAIKRRDKAYRLETEAQQLERKTMRRRARVKGDAAAKQERRREAVRQWIKPGMEVDTVHMGKATVVKVNRKTAKVRCWTGRDVNHDLMFMRRLAE